jgi:carbon storage regulator
MLVLSRKLNEEIVIGHSIHVKLLKAGRGRVRLGVSAPKGVPVHRAELRPTDLPEQHTCAVVDCRHGDT